ncbi:MAG: SlyX family protein [Sphaerochaetaceae bacterium]
MTTEERITQLEIKETYLEETVMTLDELLIKQGRNLETLLKRVEIIEGQIKQMQKGEVPSERPPHY